MAAGSRARTCRLSHHPCVFGTIPKRKLAVGVLERGLVVAGVLVSVTILERGLDLERWLAVLVVGVLERGLAVGGLERGVETRE